MAQESKSKKINRILWNKRDTGAFGRGVIDEIVMHNVDVHIEQMNDGCWWIALYDTKDPNKCWMGNFHPENPRSSTRLAFTEQDNSGIVWDQDECHE